MTIAIASKTYTIKGELPNGVFYLEGPRGGVVLAKPAGGIYAMHDGRNGKAIYTNGQLATATRDQLAA